MYKILIADDEKDIVKMLKRYFEMNGYEVITASDGKQAIAAAMCSPDIILLDINMPGGNGLEVCERIRNYVSCPILFLTARVEDRDKIRGFAVGGDDYIVKPFYLEELGARVNAHLRREQRQKNNSNVRFFGNIVVNYTTKELHIGDRQIALAKKEFEILELLSMNAGMIFDRERIYDRVWGYDAAGDSAVVTEHIRRIRAKLSEYGEANRIETVWGMGYKWVK